MKRSILSLTFLIISIIIVPLDGYCQDRLVTSNTSSLPVSSSLDKNILKEVSKYIGVRYKRGGSSRAGVDCSGFIRLIYKNIFHVDLPYIASYQSELPIFKDIPLEEIWTGDLIYFSPTSKKKRINHVGIYLSDGNFAHAIEAKGVIISSLNDPHWKVRTKHFKRINSRRLNVAHIDPPANP